MKNPVQLTEAIHFVRNSLNRASWGHGFLLLSLFLIVASITPAQGQCAEYCDFSLQLTGIGYGALQNNTTGSGNTAVGHWALTSNAEGSYNTATGEVALGNTITGSNNTANGWSALAGNRSGNNNTAIGYQAMGKNAEFTEGSFNVATGANALFSNTTGGSNTASGYLALLSNDSGSFNLANGANALEYNTTGGGNVANGGFALFSNTTGGNNVAEGFDALFNNTTGKNNIGVGLGAGGALTTGNDNIDIGNAGMAGESAKIRIGTKDTQKNTFIAGIYGVTASRGVAVFIEPSGHLGTTTSSARYKDNIHPMDKASEAILALQPVTFRYKHELDPDGIPQFGLVAEEVAKVNPHLVARDEENKPYTVRYEAVNAMLLNEFLKEHRRVEENEATITQLKSASAKQDAIIAQQQTEIKTITASLKAQASQIRKVSAQLEVTKPAPQMALNN